MNKIEFLETLRQSLEGEVNREIIEQNIRYYDQYIGNQPEGEDKALEALGNPRLIAKTIIETAKASEHNQTDSRKRESHTDDQGYGEKTGYNNNEQRNNIFYTNLKWYHKLIFVLVLLLLIIILVYIGKIIIGFLFAFGVPILLVLLLLSLFRKR
jgi:uncharacterized membrane protein